MYKSKIEYRAFIENRLTDSCLIVMQIVNDQYLNKMKNSFYLHNHSHDEFESTTLYLCRVFDV